ncbi:hypothetical protein GPK34_00985 [Secundilactobacillus kimchicus]|uniref:hypothetical protein n=1 Tax=Secundilactobacillus kimchicus TaxID=528209 RepID=UPI001C00FEE8|nr:hypothetical protein [Secundilactobacillus kimchicus]MBT9670612.1 hypothetical protein [Secundilactobacillus kimchicus]
MAIVYSYEDFTFGSIQSIQASYGLEGNYGKNSLLNALNSEGYHVERANNAQQAANAQFTYERLTGKKFQVRRYLLDGEYWIIMSRLPE